MSILSPSVQSEVRTVGTTKVCDMLLHADPRVIKGLLTFTRFVDSANYHCQFCPSADLATFLFLLLTGITK